jgi:hypothetical protein
MTGNIVELIDNETIIDYFGRPDNSVDVGDAIEEYLRTCPHERSNDATYCVTVNRERLISMTRKGWLLCS